MTKRFAGAFVGRLAFLRANSWRARGSVAILIVLAGCSRSTSVYGFAETAIAGEAAYHLDLDEAGEALVDRKIEELLAWHDSVMLPRYARYLNAQADILDRGAPDRRAVSEAVSALRQIIDDLVAGAAPFTADVLVEHTAPDKVEHIRERMAERLAERLEDADKPAEEILEARVERIVENFERLTDDLDDAQVAIVRRYAEDTAAYNDAWVRSRANRQRVIVEFLSRRPTQAKIATFIHQILLRPYEIVDPDYQSVIEGRWRRFETMLFEMMAALSAAQRATMSETLRDYAADMIELSS